MSDIIFFRPISVIPAVWSVQEQLSSHSETWMCLTEEVKGTGLQTASKLLWVKAKFVFDVAPNSVL